MPVICEQCGHKLADGSLVTMQDGSKQARCPECLSFVVIPAKKGETKPKLAPEE